VTGDQAQRERLAGAFRHQGVVRAYRHRPPYPAEVFSILDSLITDRPRDVLDLGAGDGALARPLARLVDHVTALDVSAAMTDAGRQRPGGKLPNLRWMVGAAETAVIGGPYALVTAGASLHWMPWSQVLGRLSRAMTRSALLAIVDQGPRHVPWNSELTDIIVRHSRSPGYDPGFSLADALAGAGLLEILGRATTEPVRFSQLVPSYVEQFHSTASLAREWMTADESAAFDRAVTAVVRPYAVRGLLELDVVAQVQWGRITAAHPRQR
jgi:ubiquinone/menaquinone biosynthesis C-methylase UbiE